MSLQKPLCVGFLVFQGFYLLSFRQNVCKVKSIVIFGILYMIVYNFQQRCRHYIRLAYSFYETTKNNRVDQIR